MPQEKSLLLSRYREWGMDAATAHRGSRGKGLASGLLPRVTYVLHFFSLYLVFINLLGIYNYGRA